MGVDLNPAPVVLLRQDDCELGDVVVGGALVSEDVVVGVGDDGGLSAGQDVDSVDADELGRYEFHPLGPHHPGPAIPVEGVAAGTD